MTTSIFSRVDSAYLEQLSRLRITVANGFLNVTIYGAPEMPPTWFDRLRLIAKSDDGMHESELELDWYDVCDSLKSARGTLPHWFASTNDASSTPIGDVTVKVDHFVRIMRNEASAKDFMNRPFIPEDPLGILESILHSD